MSKAANPSWLKQLTDTSKPLEVEAFSPTAKLQTEAYTTSESNGVLIAGQVRGEEKIPFALRMNKRTKERLDGKNLACSKNDAINILIEYALDDIERKNISLIIKQ